MIMGDFNDYPTNNSIAKVLGAVAPKGEVQAKKPVSYTHLDVYKRQI